MNIYISNLNFRVADDGLRQLFESFGEVSSARVITDRFTGRSRGFGFVEMPDEAAAKQAIQDLDQTEHDGKTITVNEAKPREEKPRNNNYGGRRDGGYNSDRNRERRW
ncbi:MAG: RNA-binding protein [Bacteroidales bacterium]|jgi:RNA recognition motif-containing protein|nr:RNA-binding protein [Bacteroidales bacterium]